ncbi:MAG: 5-carboxymethyl-2-hydroxymuconate semialdehyde dehydrogenase [Chloroflexota bacterium]
MASTKTLENNLTKIKTYRTQTAERGVSNIINGEHVPAVSGETFETVSPIDSTVICTVAKGDTADVDQAAQAAHDAFPAWAEMPAKKRRDLLYTVADLIEENAEEIALLESLDTGQPIRFMEKAAVRGAANYRFFADRAASARDGLTLPDDEHLNYTIRQPIGPVGVITPWNTPFMLSTWKIAPALAAGCTVVHKAAELSPVTAQRLHEIMHQAGIPNGVVNLVNGYGETAGKAVTEHPLLKAIAFVGETTTGSHIMAQGAPTLKRVHFELGGKNPVIVFADADLDRALDAVIFMKYSLNGERCTSSSRVLIERSIYDDFTAALTERVKQLKVGNPLDPATEIGPLIEQRHWNKVSSYIGISQNDGATVAVGDGQCPKDIPAGLEAGHYINPTLITDATSSMRVAQEEVFGPFLTAMPFDTEADAIAIANSVKYGLAAYIWTKDVTRAINVSHKVDAGMVWVNSQNVRYLPTPFGGVKASGIGRDGGDYSFDFYMETKNISIALGDHRIAKMGVA